MPRISMSVAGTEKLSRKLQSDQYQRKTRRIVKRNGADLSDKTKNNMSRVYTGHYEWKKGRGKVFVKPTGATSKSVTVQIKNGGYSASVGAHTKYSPYLEMGTRFMAKRPALIPAFRTQGQIFIKELKGLMND